MIGLSGMRRIQDPRLLPAASVVTTNSPIASCTFQISAGREFVAVPDGAAQEDLGGWLPNFAWNGSFSGRFQFFLAVVAGTPSWTNNGAWRTGGSVLDWVGTSNASATSVVRMDIRRLNSTLVIASQEYQVDFVV